MFGAFDFRTILFKILCNFNIDAKRADTDAIIILENIKVLNYDNGNRLVGFENMEMREVLKVIFLINIWTSKPYLTEICLIYKAIS